MSDYGDRSKAASHFNRRQAPNPFLTSQSEGPSPNAAEGVRQGADRPPQSAPPPSLSSSADSTLKTPSGRTSSAQPEFNLSRWLKNPSPNLSRQASLGQQRDRYSPSTRLSAARSAPEVRRRLQPPQFSANPSTPQPTAFTGSRSNSSPRQANVQTNVQPIVNQPRQASPSETRAGRPVKPDANKVTPIRPEQVWPPSESRRRSRDRRPAKHLRRPKKAASQPLLYLVRLSILGIGMAAIVGTLLSIFSPIKAGSQVSQSTRRQASRSSLQTSSSSRRPVVNLALPLANELVYLRQDIEELGAAMPGLSLSVFVLDLDTGNYVDVAGSEAFPAASTIKTPILVAFLQDIDAGLIQLDQSMTLQPDMVAGGSGEMQTQPLGTEYTAWEVASKMIINSDNTATNMMINLLGGATKLNQRFQSWGLAATVIRSPLPDLEGTNTTSTRDMANLTALVNRGELLSLRSRDRWLTIMQRTQTRSLIPKGVGERAIVSNKTGDIGSVLGDMALVDAPNGKRYAIAALIRRPHNDGRARELIRRISQSTFQELNRSVPPAGKAELVPVEIPVRREGGSP